MSLPAHIEEMIRHSETIQVEFKEDFPKKDFAEHIMAFANRYGGHILVGVRGTVNPDGSQIGQRVGFESTNIDENKQRIDGWARTLRPAVKLLANQEYQLEPGRWLLHVQVEEHREKPVGTDAGLYKIRTHSGTNPMDHSAMRTAVFEEERALKSLRACLERNIGHAQGILSSMNQGALPVTVFEKAVVLSALAAPDVYEKVDQAELAAAYQAYEIVDRLMGIKITWRPMGDNFADIDWLIQNHTQDAITRSTNLLKRIDDKLLRVTNCPEVPLSANGETSLSIVFSNPQPA